MKNLTIVLLFTCLGALLTSCSKTDVAPSIPLVPMSNKPATSEDIANPATNPSPVAGKVSYDTTLEGTWKIVNDSTHYDGGEVAANARSNNYSGTPDDYFTFTNTGKLYVKENGAIDTANYSVTAENKITVNYTFYNGAAVSSYGSVVANFNQLNLTSTTVTLSSNVITTQGVFSRVLNLKR